MRFLDDASVGVSRFVQVSEWWVARLARSDRAGSIRLAWPQGAWQIQIPERGLNVAIVLSSVVLLWLLIWLVRVTAVQVSEFFMDALNAVLEPLGWPTM